MRVMYLNREAPESGGFYEVIIDMDAKQYYDKESQGSAGVVSKKIEDYGSNRR